KIQLHRLRTKPSDINTYFQQIIEPRNAMKVTFEMHARQPNPELVKEHSVMQPNGTKQFRLRKLEEMNVSAVKDNARRIDITPAHALFNRKFFVGRHQFSWTTRSGNPATL